MAVKKKRSRPASKSDKQKLYNPKQSKAKEISVGRLTRSLRDAYKPENPSKLRKSCKALIIPMVHVDKVSNRLRKLSCHIALATP